MKRRLTTLLVILVMSSFTLGTLCMLGAILLPTDPPPHIATVEPLPTAQIRGIGYDPAIALEAIYEPMAQGDKGFCILVAAKPGYQDRALCYPTSEEAWIAYNELVSNIAQVDEVLLNR